MIKLFVPLEKSLNNFCCRVTPQLTLQLTFQPFYSITNTNNVQDFVRSNHYHKKFPMVPGRSSLVGETLNHPSWLGNSCDISGSKWILNAYRLYKSQQVASFDPILLICILVHLPPSCCKSSIIYRVKNQRTSHRQGHHKLLLGKTAWIHRWELSSYLPCCWITMRSEQCPWSMTWRVPPLLPCGEACVDTIVDRLVKCAYWVCVW